MERAGTDCEVSDYIPSCEEPLVVQNCFTTILFGGRPRNYTKEQ
jgi:hypothetical protein